MIIHIYQINDNGTGSDIDPYTFFEFVTYYAGINMRHSQLQRVESIEANLCSAIIEKKKNSDFFFRINKLNKSKLP